MREKQFEDHSSRRPDVYFQVSGSCCVDGIEGHACLNPETAKGTWNLRLRSDQCVSFPLSIMNELDYFRNARLV